MKRLQGLEVQGKLSPKYMYTLKLPILCFTKQGEWREGDRDNSKQNKPTQATDPVKKATPTDTPVIMPSTSFEQANIFCFVIFHVPLK